MLGGNPGRASYKADGTVNNVNSVDPKRLPPETWTPQIFSPPYLFGTSERPVIEKAPTTVKRGGQGSLTVTDATAGGQVVLIRLGNSTHAFDNTQVLYTSTITQKLATGVVTFSAPSNRNSYPDGYYMVFYVNASGKPSVAKMVQLVP